LNNTQFDPYFLNENYGFVAFPFCGSISRTTNGGKTWMNIKYDFGSGQNGIFQMFFESSNHIYLSSGIYRSIYESLDSGITWKDISPSSGSGIYVAHGIIFDAAGDARSSDDGKTWVVNSPAFQGKSSEQVIGNKENGIVCFSIGSGNSDNDGFGFGDLYSLDGGNTWLVGQPKDECWSGYAVPFSLTYFRASEWASTSYHKSSNLDSGIVLRTKDGGATWEKVFPNFLPPCWLTGGIAGGGCAVYAQSRYHHIPSDFSVIGGVWRSTDLGNTWDSIGGPANEVDTRISSVSRGAICYVNDYRGNLWKFTDSSLLRHATWDFSFAKSSASISNDTLYAKTCDSAKITLKYGFTSCDYVKLDTISVEGIPRSDYRVDFIKDKVIMQGRADTSGITFIPSLPGTYHIKVHTFIMRDDWVREDTAFSLVLVVKPNPAIFNLSPKDTINFGTQTLCNLHTLRDTIHVFNTGCDALKVQSIILETDAGAKNEYTFTNISNLTLQRSDAIKNFPVTFTPKTIGNKIGRIIIVTSLGVDTIFLQAFIDSNGIVGLDRKGINFDSVSTCLSVTKSAYLINNDCDSVFVTEDAPPIQGSFLRTSPSLPFWLHAGDSLLITVTYAPKAIGLDLDSVVFLGKNSKGKSRFLTLVLSGYGEPGGGILSYSPKQFDFKSLSICNQDSASGFVTNIGCDSLLLDPTTITGDPDFKLSANGSLVTLRPNDTLHYQLYLNPTQKGLKNKSFVFTSSDRARTNRDTVRFSVTVTDGTRILFSPLTAADFGSIPVCDERDTLVTIKNTGCDTLIISSLNGLGLGFGTDTKFPITILPKTDTVIHIFTLLDTAGGKLSTTGTLTFTSNSDNTLPPITLSRTFLQGIHRDVGLYLDATAKTGGNFSTVTYDIKESPNKTFAGAGVKNVTFDLNYNTDLLDFDQSKSSNVTSSDGKSFTISNPKEIIADGNGILATVGFSVYLTKDSVTTISMTNRTDTTALPCGSMTLSTGGSATFDYNYFCGERSLAGFMNGVMPMKIVSLRPNPSQEEIELDLQSASKQNAQVEIFDALGVKVFSETRNIVAGSNRVQLNTKGLSGGMYFVRIGGASQSFVKIH